MYGTQTYTHRTMKLLQFENDVEMYGTQTKVHHLPATQKFENDVEMYGTQTPGSVKASVCNHYFE